MLLLLNILFLCFNFTFGCVRREFFFRFFLCVGLLRRLDIKYCVFYFSFYIFIYFVVVVIVILLCMLRYWRSLLRKLMESLLLIYKHYYCNETLSRILCDFILITIFFNLSIHERDNKLKIYIYKIVLGNVCFWGENWLIGKLFIIFFYVNFL